MDSAPDTEPLNELSSVAVAAAAEERREQEEEDENDLLMARAQGLMDRITANHENPNPNVLHALSTLLETQESRYMEDTDPSSTNNGRSSHNVGRLGNMIRDNDEFFELISSNFLTRSNYSVSVQAASTRLLFSCSLTWTYPHVFEDDTLDKLRGWVMDEPPRSGTEKHETGRKKASDFEMLRTYSTGLLAVCLASGGQLVEDVLTSGLPSKLMRYLRIRVLGEKDANSLTENKNASSMVGPKIREEGRSRVRHITESSQTDDHDRVGEDIHDSLTLEVDAYEAEIEGGEKCSIKDVRESKTKPIGKHSREEDLDDPCRRRTNRVLSRSRSRARSSEGASEDKNQDLKKVLKGSEKVPCRNNPDSFILERADNDECFQGCIVGSKDISDLVKKAVLAAEAEARAANAPAEAIKAAGDDAAEVVKTAALEEYAKSNDEENAVVAALKAASTVIDAPNAVALSRISINAGGDSGSSKPTEPEHNEEDIGEIRILDSDTLAKLMEKFCIETLVILGEYVEVLGPVLHEKGVDVSLALLQRSFKHKEASKTTLLLLPDILKLINALAAHRKFAALFIDRGGMQRLIAVPRNHLNFSGLSSCLFTIASIQGIMERVCALPSSVVHQIVELALQLLDCPQDQARKNAALFFAAAFVFRAIIDAFDEQDGLQKLLHFLHDVASVRSGIIPPGPLNNSRNDRSPADVLTSSEKQIAYHTCVALRQYFRAHLLLLVDSVRPTKSIRSAPRNISSVRAAYKPLDISNEAIDVVFRQIQKDRKLGPAFVRDRWPSVDKFLNLNGHITMLELCQAPPVERYLHDLLQYALGVLHIVTLVPYSRKLIVNATLSNDRVGIAVILDAANGSSYVEPEIVEPALNLLINLVCPPPSISNKPSILTPGQQSASTQTGGESRDRNTDRPANLEPTSVDRASSSALASGLVGDRRISLGAGAGLAGLAAQLEQGYHQAREAVRANNGIKVILQLLQPRMVTSPAALDCLRALTCRVLLGLARDDTIAHILTKLQVGKKLSELLRDSGNQTPGGEQNRWQAELTQVAIELIGVVTNSGRASNLAASDAATPTLRRIERAAIAAATPISYHSSELLLLIHEHLQASGLSESASALLKETQLTPLSSSSALSSQVPGQEASSVQTPWPSGRAPAGFLADKLKAHEDLVAISSKRKPRKLQPKPETPSAVDFQLRTPIVLPMKRKLTDSKEIGLLSSMKKLKTDTLSSPGFTTPNPTRHFTTPISTPKDPFDETPSQTCHGLLNETQSERLTLDSLVVQYLKHQHRQCAAPITTLPPLSLLHPHMCPEPRQSPDAPSNVTARLSTREFRSMYGGIHGSRKDRQFVYSRFRPWRTCRDETPSLLTCVSFLGDSSRIAAGTHMGELKVFDSNNNTVLESCTSHQFPLTLIQTHVVGGEAQLVLSSSATDVRLWDPATISGGPKYSFQGIKAARFSNSGAIFAALRPEMSQREILLYDVESCQLDLTLKDTSNGLSGRGHAYSLVHFNPSDSMLLWNGVLWDRRGSGPIRQFDQFTDYGGGGFHPAGNEVIINSEVWDLRNFRLLRSVPSLDQTVITFNSSGDVIYAILRRNLEEVSLALNPRRVKHPLFSAFRTVDAVNYSDIATIPVDRCVLDFATEPTDSFVGLITVDDQDEMCSSARVYEIGRRKPTDDDSDPDDADSEEEDDDDEGDDDDDSILDVDLDGDGESDDGDDMSNDDDDDDDGLSEFDEDADDDGDFGMGLSFDEGGILEILSEGDEEDSDFIESYSSGEEDL